MARLCIQMHPLLQDSVLKRLQQWKIFTIVDLLEEDPEKLVHITELSYKDVLKIRQSITIKYSAPARKGADIYQELIANTALISTGIESLDAILEGGFLTGKIYELCGPSGSGKTQLCLTISSNVTSRFQQKLHYIDTKKDFSGRRILQMLEARNCQDKMIGVVLEKTQVTRIQNIYELFSFLHHLKEKEHENITRIIVLDSAAVLFFPFLGENSNDGLGLMQQLSNMMKYIVTEYHIVFIVVNLAVQWIEEDSLITNTGVETSMRESASVEMMRPAIGKSWLDVPCTRLLINRVDSEGEARQISVIKSTYLTVGKQCAVSINEKGVVTS